METIPYDKNTDFRLTHNKIICDQLLLPKILLPKYSNSIFSTSLLLSAAE